MATMTVSSISSPNRSRLMRPRATPAASLSVKNWLQPLPFQRSWRGFLHLSPKCSQGFVPFPLKRRGFSFAGRNLGFGCARAEKGKGNGVHEVEEDQGESTMPDRFRYLSKEAPDRPVRWPWLIALAFLIYAWRMVLWELHNWKKTALAIAHFMGYLLKLALALVFHFFGDSITSLIRCMETTFYTVRAFYSSILAYAPVPELVLIIVLTSAVIAIAEAAVPESASSQTLLTLAGAIGFAAVKGAISDAAFLFSLFALFGVARFIKKRDYVSSALPVALVLTAIGTPWMRATVMTLYAALAIARHSRKPLQVKKGDGGDAEPTRTPPLPLLAVSLAIGMHLAVKWAGYRHLTWMVA